MLVRATAGAGLSSRLRTAGCRSSGRRGLPTLPSGTVRRSPATGHGSASTADPGLATRRAASVRAARGRGRAARRRTRGTGTPIAGIAGAVAASARATRVAAIRGRPSGVAAGVVSGGLGTPELRGRGDDQDRQQDADKYGNHRCVQYATSDGRGARGVSSARKKLSACTGRHGSGRRCRGQLERRVLCRPSGPDDSPLDMAEADEAIHALICKS